MKADEAAALRTAIASSQDRVEQMLDSAPKTRTTDYVRKAMRHYLATRPPPKTVILGRNRLPEPDPYLFETFESCARKSQLQEQVDWFLFVAFPIFMVMGFFAFVLSR